MSDGNQTGKDDQLVTVGNAAAATGISERTLRYWITSGKLPAIAGKRGKRVKMGDVMVLGELTGKLRGNVQKLSENQNTSAVATAGNTAGTEQLRAMLETLRDELVSPYLEKIERQAERIGRLEAERDQLQTERDELRAKLRPIEARQDVEKAGDVQSVEGTAKTSQTGKFWARLRSWRSS